MKNDRGIVLGTLLLLFALAIFSAGRFSSPRAGQLTPIAERHPAPALAVTDLAGQPWTLPQHQGQIILINYWATWCGPCIEEAPGLAELAQDPALKKLAILGISLDSGGETPANRAKVEAFARRFHINYPLAFATPALPLGPSFCIPTTVLGDRHGRIARLYEGAVRRNVFTADIQQLLAEP